MTNKRYEFCGPSRYAGELTAVNIGGTYMVIDSENKHYGVFTTQNAALLRILELIEAR